MVESKITERQQGIPLLMGKELESQVKEIIQELGLANRTVNTIIMLATGRM